LDNFLTTPTPKKTTSLIQLALHFNTENQATGTSQPWASAIVIGDISYHGISQVIALYSHVKVRLHLEGAGGAQLAPAPGHLKGLHTEWRGERLQAHHGSVTRSQLRGIGAEHYAWLCRSWRCWRNGGWQD